MDWDWSRYWLIREIFGRVKIDFREDIDDEWILVEFDRLLFFYRFYGLLFLVKDSVWRRLPELLFFR